ncbi:uncharacterized protein BJ171DRAFT_454137 [Polychytrium aggregatum]|uniref:uncharacterized protein n=1 Tax=Polychytrium aggregatum TaxID=110093 RepID=UPI0022FF3E24|nr:uncharacterized protein BJ171DRAFT_454137 [Polychytrium aggregatum]KAI9209177.1 hypothetical protein BJ171DRAFT_454137 [Polychytrium aggregatum]
MLLLTRRALPGFVQRLARPFSSPPPPLPSSLHRDYRFPVATVRDILQKKIEDQADESQNMVQVHGWVQTVRTHKQINFAEIADGSTVRGIQVTLTPNQARELKTGTSVRIIGALVQSPGKNQAVEIQSAKVQVLGHISPNEYPLSKSKLPIDHLREHAHLRSRSRTFGAVWRLRSAAVLGFQKFFQSQQFIQIHTPIITSNDCEGAGEVFRVVAGEQARSATKPSPSLVPSDQSAIAAPPSSKPLASPQEEFFSRPVYLTVSGQLHAEIASSALSRVYTFGPTFRAEHSLSSRHLAEFWMLEAEMSFISKIDELLDFIEAGLKQTTQHILDTQPDDIDFLTQFVDNDLRTRLENFVNQEWKRITYTEAVSVLQGLKKKWDYPVKWGLPLQGEHERFLAGRHFQCPVFVTEYPKDLKPFYMREASNPAVDPKTNELLGKVVSCTDLLVPKVGELVGGSLRESNYKALLSNIERAGIDRSELEWYLDLRRFGTVPHGGFGMGFERYLQYITGMSSVRDCILAPRYYGHIKY